MHYLRDEDDDDDEKISSGEIFMSLCVIEILPIKYGR